MKTAGIVIFNPDRVRLRQNIDAIYPQVDCLFVYLNSPMKPGQAASGDKLVVLGDGVNRGIGVALNAIMAAAESRGAEWCLLLDQDSVVSENMVLGLEDQTGLPGAGILAPEIVDINECGDDQHPRRENPVDEIDMCITSGSYNNVAVWRAAGGFREEFFIDYVDWEYCARIRRQGYRVYRCNDLCLSHALGARTYHRFLGREMYTFNHSAFRKYYITRNTIVSFRLFPGEAKLAHPWLRTWKRFLLTLLYEGDKGSKARAIVRGALDSRKLYRQLKQSERK